MEIYLGERNATIKPTTEGKKTRITKKLVAGRAMAYHWPVSWEGRGLHPGSGRGESAGMPPLAALKWICHLGYISQLKMGWNDLKIVPKYSLALKLAQIPMLLKKWGNKNLGNYQLCKWSLPRIIQILALFQETGSFCFQLMFSCLPRSPLQCKNLVSCTTYQGFSRGWAVLSPRQKWLSLLSLI